MRNHNFNSKYIILILALAALLAAFAMQAVAVTTEVTTPYNGSLSTIDSGDIDVIVSSDGNYIHSNSWNPASTITAQNGTVTIHTVPGGPTSLDLTTYGQAALNVKNGGKVSSDANLKIGSYGTYGEGIVNTQGVVNLKGVNIFANMDGIRTTDNGITTFST